MEWTRSDEDLLVRIDQGKRFRLLAETADEVGFNAAAITSGIGRTCNNVYGYMNNDGSTLSEDSKTVRTSQFIGKYCSNKIAMPSLTSIAASDDDNNVHAGHMFSSTVWLLLKYILG